jgi:hypothetical protein
MFARFRARLPICRRAARTCTAIDAVAASSRSMPSWRPARGARTAVAIGGQRWRRRPVEALGRDLPVSRPGLHRDRRPHHVEAPDAAREPRLSFAALILPPIAAATCVGLSQMSRRQRCYPAADAPQ